MELEKILNELNKFLVDNEDNLNHYQWGKLYNAKENIKEIIKTIKK